MRLAVLVDPRASEATPPAVRGERILWLRDSLARLGFDVVALGDEPDAAQLERVLAGVEPTDTVLLHVSGQLAAGGSVRVGPDQAVPLAVLCGAVAARTPASVLYFAELTHDGPADALRSAEHVTELRSAIEASAPGYGALLAVGARSSDRDPLAFTRIALRMAEDLAAGEEHGVRLSEVVERVRAQPESAAAAQGFALVRGRVEFRLSPASLEKPLFEPLAALADGARERKQWEHALAGYKAAILVAPSEAMQGPLYARIGEVELARGNALKANRAYVRARDLCPSNRTTLDALIALATDGEEWTRAVELSHERLALLEGASEQVDELFSIARMLGKLGDMAGAVTELERARALDPKNDDVLEALRRAYRVLSRWPKLLEVTGALGDLAPSATERAARLVAQAQIAIQHLGDTDRAVHFLEGALEDDPTHDEALDMLVELRTSRGEHERLEATVAALVLRFEELGEAERARDANTKLEAIRARSVEDSLVPEADEEEAGEADVVVDPTTEALTPRALPVDEGSADPLTVRVEHEPDANDVDVAGVEPEVPTSRGEEDLAALEQMVLEAPLDPSVHARLFALHTRDGNADRAYLETLALEELGALEQEHEDVLEQQRPEGLRVRSTLDDAGWQMLQAPGGDPVVEALFGAIGRAAAAICVEDRRAKKKLTALDPARRLDDGSTASIVRSFHWAARVLAVQCPDLYVLDTVYGDIAAVPARQPSTVIGPAVLRGLSTKDLAFLAGRHLTYYRPDYNVLLHFPTLPELRVLLLAGVRVVLPGVPIPAAAAPAVSALSASLAARLSDDERDALAVAVNRLDARGGRVDLNAWTRCVELTASRAGLLLSGDLRTAMTRLRTETREVAEVTFDEKRKDLLACCSSSALAELRTRVALVASPIPPRTSGTMPRADFQQTTDWGVLAVDELGPAGRLVGGRGRT